MSDLFNNKTLVLGVAGVVAFGAAYWFNKPADSEPAFIQPVASGTRTGRAAPSVTPTAATLFSAIDTPERGVMFTKGQKDVFLPRSWLPPLPPPPAPPPPPTPPPPVIPVAPPVPFVFVGALDEKGGVSRVFLSKGDQLLIAKVNDVLESSYRIDQITDSAVTLTYLPLNQKQIMSIQQGGI